MTEKPSAHITAQVPASDSGTVMPAAIVGVRRRRKTNTTSITSAIEMASVSCMSATLARIVVVRSDSTLNVDARRDPALQIGQQRLHAVDRVDDVGVRLLA